MSPVSQSVSQSVVKVRGDAINRDAPVVVVGVLLAVAESVAVSRMPAAEDGRITEGRIKGRHPAR